MPSNRALNVTVNFTSTEDANGNYAGQVTFTQTSSSPPMNGVVDINGNINLDNLPGNSNYNWAIGINFTLNAMVHDRNGNNLLSVWATPTSKACSVYAPDGSAATNMVVTQNSSTPLLMSIANPNNDQSKSKANRTYTYKPGVMLPTVDNYFIGLDPTMTNSGTRVMDDDEDNDDQNISRID